MRLLLFILGICVSLVGTGQRAEAQDYPWCAEYSGGGLGGGTNRLRQFCAVHGDSERHWRVLHSEYAIRTAAGSAPATAPSKLSLAGR